jgi:peptidoglycan/LPS O-acetylase OafA/YrhL
MTESTIDHQGRVATDQRLAAGPERIIALDGLRAVALLIIMGYHFGVSWLQGGFFSLDIFYVLSGYLITGLLLREYRKRDRISLSAFWLRRARRLLPALMIVLVAVVLMVRYAEPAGLYTGIRLDALSALFYFSNWWQIAVSGNYFVANGVVSPLTHTWSLSVEEQFYLIWPLVVLSVMALSRTFTRGVKVLLALSAAGAVASALEMAALFGPKANITRLYFGTDTHAQSIMVGAALACALTMIEIDRGRVGMAPPARSKRARVILTFLGLCGVGGTLTLTYFQTGTSAFDYRGGFLLSAMAAAAIVVGAVCVPGGPIAFALSRRPLVWIGTVSYGAYLWHYPVAIYLDAARTGLHGFLLLTVRIVTTLALSAASFYLVERPVMEGTFWRSLKAVIPATVLVGGTVAVIVGATASEALAVPALAIPTQSPTIGAKATIPILLTGDSTALTLGISIGLRSEEEKYGVDVIDDATEGCGVAEGRFLLNNGTARTVAPACNPDAPAADQWPSILQRELLKYRPRVVVLLAGYWEVFDRTDLAGRLTDITNPQYARYIESQLQRFVSIVASAGHQAVLMTAPFYDAAEQPDGQPPPQNDPVRVREYNDLLRQAVMNNPRSASLVDLNRIVSPHGQFTASIGKVTVRAPDGIHFAFYNVFVPTQASPDTLAQVTTLARWLGPRLFPPIIKAAQR